MYKPRSINKDWDFVTKGTELSAGTGFMLEYFTPLTSDDRGWWGSSWMRICTAVREEVMNQFRKNRSKREGAETHLLDEKEVELDRTFGFSWTDGWVINKKMERIILLEFKRTKDTSENYRSTKT
jgi:hypothetical protein